MILGHLSLLMIAPKFRALVPAPFNPVLTDCFDPGPITLDGWNLTTPSGIKLFLPLWAILNIREVTFSDN